jgi:hypothetical protein
MIRCDQGPDRSSRDAPELAICTRPMREHCPGRCGSVGLLHGERRSEGRSAENRLLTPRRVMTGDRRIELWSLLVTEAGSAEVGLEHVGAVMLAVAGVTGVAVTVQLPATPREAVYVSDRVATELEELILTLGEGPSVDALRDGPVLVSDLTDPDCATQWPVFTDAAVGAGVRALFSLPLRVGAARLGVMDLYRDKPGALERPQLADALILADTACALLLDAQRVGPAPGRYVPVRAGPHHPEVHQATGMISVQRGVSIAVALMRLRAYAYANERRLRDVAADVVARRLRLDADAARGEQ